MSRIASVSNTVIWTGTLDSTPVRPAEPLARLVRLAQQVRWVRPVQPVPPARRPELPAPHAVEQQARRNFFASIREKAPHRSGDEALSFYPQISPICVIGVPK